FRVALMTLSLMTLARTAKQVVETSAGVRPGENVCIVTDTNVLSIASAIAAACHAVDAETVTCVMTPRQMHGNEPPRVVAAAMKAADVVIAPTTYALTHTDARIEATRAGVRIVVLREITEDTFLHGAMTADYEAIDAISRSLAETLTEGNHVRVHTSKGTDLSMSIAGRRALHLGGVAREPGSLTSLPSGEAAIVPAEGSAEGVIVVDHAIDGIGLVDTPVTLTVRAGQVVAIEGGKAAGRLEQILAESDDNATNVAEFAIGTNPLSRMRGNIAEDKILEGSVHIAVGDSHTIGGNVTSQTHLDNVILRPTVWLDEREIVHDGTLQDHA
ncbi:MAG: aminopeptidase, partial [Anaerolineae bacterium]